MLKTIRVMVTGVGGGGHGHEIVKALRLAGRYHLIGVDMMESSFGLFDVDEAYTVPPASESHYLDVLLDICQQRRAKVLIHGSEPELKVISRNRDRILKAGLLPLINSHEVIERCMDKWATVMFLREKGFDCPVSIIVNAEGEIPRDFSLPAVVKPAIGGGGSNNIFLVQDVDELVFSCRYLIQQNKVALVQEYVGTPEDEYTVGVLSAFDGELVGSIALRRYILSGLSNRIHMPNRTTRSDLSSILAISSGISQGIIDDYSEVRQLCERIAKALPSKGPLNIQCRFVDGKLYPFEINPRFSGTTFIRALVGFNEPDMLIRRHLLGEVLPNPVRYKFGRVVRGLVERCVDNLSTVTPWQKRFGATVD
jgi:carbamoyl-phosphate synthase large subunit